MPVVFRAPWSVSLRNTQHVIPVPDLKATNSFSRISDSGDLLRISSRLIQIWYNTPSEAFDVFVWTLDKMNGFWTRKRENGKT